MITAVVAPSNAWSGNSSKTTEGADRDRPRAAPTALAAPAGPPLALVVRGCVLLAMWGACGNLGLGLVWWPVWLRVDVQREPGGAWLQLHQRWRPLQLVPVKHICGGCQVDTQERS